MDMNQIIIGVTLTKVCSVSPDEDSEESKRVTLRVKFDGCKLVDVFEKAMSATVIQVQAKLRKNFVSLKDNSVQEVTFSAPTRTTVDPIEYVITQAKASGVTVEEYLKAELAKRVAPKLEPLK